MVRTNTVLTVMFNFSRKNFYLCDKVEKYSKKYLMCDAIFVAL